jgi:hypothetical protein
MWPKEMLILMLGLNAPSFVIDSAGVSVHCNLAFAQLSR